MAVLAVLAVLLTNPVTALVTHFFVCSADVNSKVMCSEATESHAMNCTSTNFVMPEPVDASFAPETPARTTSNALERQSTIEVRDFHATNAIGPNPATTKAVETSSVPTSPATTALDPTECKI